MAIQQRKDTMNRIGKQKYKTFYVNQQETKQKHEKLHLKHKKRTIFSYLKV